MQKRKPYFKKSGRFVRGTVIKPKYFKEKLVVDKDFDTKTARGEDGQLDGRDTETKNPERTAVIRNSSGEIVGRTKLLKRPYPKQYPISSGKKRRMIPVINWD